MPSDMAPLRWNRTMEAAQTLRRLAPLIATLAVLPGCDERNCYKPPPPPIVQIAHPDSRSVARYLEATGYLAPVNSVDLVARVQGFLEEIDYQDGEFVKRGTRLFTIEPEPYRLKREQAEAESAGAQARLVQAESDYKRQAELASRQNAPQTAVEQALAKRDSVRADLRSAQANIGLAKINYDYTQVSAPFDGIVTSHLVSVGELVGDGKTHLATIVQTDPIYVNFSISEQDVLRIRTYLRESGLAGGDLKTVQVEVGLQNEIGFPHKGHMDYASPTFDAATGTLAVRAVLPNSDRVLLPGNFARVRIPIERARPALLVLDTAIGSDQSGRYVLVVNETNVVEQRKVEPGSLVNGWRVIESGLKPDDRVVVNGLMRTVPGQKVEAQMIEAGAVPTTTGP